MNSFGYFLRTVRERLRAGDPGYSQRQVALRIGIEPAYLSKIERGEVPPPSEETIYRIAAELGEDPDILLAMAGRVSGELQRIIRERPRIFADLISAVRYVPDHAVQRIVHELRAGRW
jgi:transcriptional regulator with XRE-family HTH domain